MKEYTVGILGATGAVGTQMLQCLVEQEFPVARLRLFASARSAGKAMRFKDEDIVIEEATPEVFAGCDIVLGAADDAIAKALLPAAVEAGATVVDNSHAFRMDPEVPLVIPEINAQDVSWHHGIIANPNCATIIALVPTWPLHQLAAEGVVGHPHGQRPLLRNQVGRHPHGPGQNEGQRLVGAFEQIPCHGRHTAEITGHIADRIDQHDHAFLVLGTFQGIDAGDGFGIGRIAPHTPQRIGRIDDDASAAQHLDRTFNRFLHGCSGLKFRKIRAIFFLFVEKVILLCP